MGMKDHRDKMNVDDPASHKEEALHSGLDDGSLTIGEMDQYPALQQAPQGEVDDTFDEYYESDSSDEPMNHPDDLALAIAMADSPSQAPPSPMSSTSSMEGMEYEPRLHFPLQQHREFEDWFNIQQQGGDAAPEFEGFQADEAAQQPEGQQEDVMLTPQDVIEEPVPVFDDALYLEGPSYFENERRRREAEVRLPRQNNAGMNRVSSPQDTRYTSMNPLTMAHVNAQGFRHNSFCDGMIAAMTHNNSSSQQTRYNPPAGMGNTGPDNRQSRQTAPAVMGNPRPTFPQFPYIPPVTMAYNSQRQQSYIAMMTNNSAAQQQQQYLVPIGVGGRAFVQQPLQNSNTARNSASQQPGFSGRFLGMGDATPSQQLPSYRTNTSNHCVCDMCRRMLQPPLMCEICRKYFQGGPPQQRRGGYPGDTVDGNRFHCDRCFYGQPSGRYDLLGGPINPASTQSQYGSPSVICQNCIDQRTEARRSQF